MEQAGIEINDELWIPESELDFVYSRSSGPGGQNVNKVSTKVALRFDLEASPSLSDDQRQRIRERLANRITRDGVLQVVCQRHRTQPANQRGAVERFAELMAQALREQPPRRARRVPSRERVRRLQSKRRRSQTKELRRPPRADE